MRFRGVVLACVLLAASCGGQSREAPPPGSPESEERPNGLEGHPALELVGAKVFDAKGNSKACEAPREGCPEASPARDFVDKCRLAGYQVRRCGCEEVCTGNVMQPKKHYDAKGNSKDCSPEDANCTPPDTPAAFQDACTDGGHKLVVCGCEWLCNGALKKGSGDN